MKEETTDLKPFVRRVVDGHCLSVEEASDALDVIMTGNATPAQVGALLTALRVRGETVEEIAGFARTMRRHALRVDLEPDERPLVDTCGTGGDGAGTFNISTTAAFVAAGAGVRVAKHGNRSMTSRCGSADVLEGLGVNVMTTPEQVARCIAGAGIGFMFAQTFHPAMKHVGPVRREIGIRTIFNVLGPLTNPAGVTRQIVGIGERLMAERLAGVLEMLGAERALVVSSADGLDEIGVDGPTEIVEYDRAAGTRRYAIDPAEHGLEVGPRQALLGGSVEENVAITRGVLEGEPGPRRTATVINAAAALYAAGAVESIPNGIDSAERSIDSGAARRAMDELVRLSHVTTP